MHGLLDVSIIIMPRFDPYNDPEQVFTVHDRLELALEEKEGPTTQALKDSPITGILSCPTEVVDRIFQHISDNHDLAQLCKVNRRFFATALPRLYHTLQININPRLDSAILQMLTRENTGLRFVRNVYVYPCKDISNNVPLSNQCFQIVINSLPQNRLRGLHWLDRDPLPAIIMSTLWQRQRNLRHIEIVPEADLYRRHGQSEHQRQLERLKFPDLKAVRAVLKEFSTVYTASMALRLGHVVDLEVDALFWVGEDPHEYNPEPEDTNPSPDSEPESEGEETAGPPDPDFFIIDPLTQGLFDHLVRMKPGYTPPFDQITTLTLKDINLGLSRHTWFTYLSLKSLRHLGIEYCEGADIFLLHLIERFPVLHSFQLAHRLDDQSDRTVHAIEELLKYLPIHRLQVLKLCLRNAHAAPSVLSLIKHRDSLEQLQIDVAKRLLPVTSEEASGYRNTGEGVEAPLYRRNSSGLPRKTAYIYRVYNPKDFELLIKSCIHLRELSIALPSYQLYFNHLGVGPHENVGFSKYINIIVRNLELCTLNIVNWPTNYKYSRSERYYKAKNASLARVASTIFKRHRTYNPDTDSFDTKTRYSPLDIVSFGVNERLSTSATAPRPAHFLQSTFEAQGLKGFSAQQMDELELYKRALDTHIFDYGERDFDKTSRKVHSALCWSDDSDDDDSQGSLGE